MVAVRPGASLEVVNEQVVRPPETAIQAVEGQESSSATSRARGRDTVRLRWVGFRSSGHLRGGRGG